MVNIKLIKDKNCNINTDGVADLINGLVDKINIEVVDNNYDINDKLIKAYATHKKHFKNLKNNTSTKTFLIITDVPYEDNFFLHDYENLAIISFYGWEHLTDLPKENGLLYWICAVSLSFIQTTYVRHYDMTGCLNDFLGDKTAIDIGMRQAYLCQGCLKKLKKKTNTPANKQLLKNIETLLDHLSQNSRWNKNVLVKKVAPLKPRLAKRKPITKGEINVLIASPSDTSKERELLLTNLERRFRTSGFESSTRFRVVTHGWEDLPSQSGYPQDIINELILPRIDIVIGILKHKLGTPITNAKGTKRAESGTAEELYFALEKNPDTVLCMLYVFSKAPAPSLDDSNFTVIKENWDTLQKFKTKIQNRVLYKTYSSEEELLDIVLKDLPNNIKTYFTN